MCIPMDKVKRCFGRVIHHNTIAGFKNAKINFLKKINVFIAVFIELKYGGEFNNASAC